jgi:4-hydroxythreonine-4-phosphate dehydrogenase
MTTRPLPIKDIAGSITKETVVEKTRVFFNTLKRDFIITNPRIAILALNPSAGKEEQEIIIPAIADLEAKGIQAFGPYPADTFFGDGMYEAFDGVLAMYHDQGLAPFRTIDMGEGVCYTAGLPIIRTSAAANYDMSVAGKGVTDETSFRHAIYLAIDVARRRHTSDTAGANPLPKLYHEKRDDSEKVRFAIPKSKTEKKAE